MLVNNEIGNIYPIKEISEIVHKKNKSTLMHTDATQAIGKMKVDVQDLGVDYLTMSGHKIYAPKGIGALYIKDSSRFTPFIHGGHQENNLRAGTENFISIVALGQAIQDIMEKEDYERDNERKLRDLLEEKIKKIMKGARILGDIDNRVCNTSCVLLDHMDGHIVCIKAEEIDGVYISAGSACNSDNVKPSHVMEAIGVNQIPIRVSIGRFTSENDILACVQTLMKIKKTKKFD